MVPDLPERHLQLLEYPEEPLHRADVLADRLGGGGDLPGVERVVDPPVRGQAGPQPIRNAALRVAGDEGQFGVRQPGGRLNEPHRRAEQVGRDEGGEHHDIRDTPLRMAQSRPGRPRHARVAFQA